jgi:Uma2 family endonuclease
MAVSTTDMTVADLLERFGPLPVGRIRANPPPGTATEQDVVDIEAQESRLYELVDGILVEKALGVYESYLALEIGSLLREFAGRNGPGFVVGADGMVRLAPGLVRIPDVSFVSWDRLPERRVPRVPVADLAPDLAVEVISPGNTAREMEQKLQEYLAAGVRLVWYVLPEPREVRTYTAERHDVLTLDQELSGGDVLPGFALPLRQLFEESEQR